MKEIVKKNLEKMCGSNEGDMQSLLAVESFGGNAGVWRNCSCAGANFYYDGYDGEIVYFGNIQDVPRHIVEDFKWDVFRVALDVKKKKLHIVDYKASKEISEYARGNLEESVKLYNKEFGFDEDLI